MKNNDLTFALTGDRGGFGQYLNGGSRAADSGEDDGFLGDRNFSRIHLPTRQQPGCKSWNGPSA